MLVFGWVISLSSVLIFHSGWKDKAAWIYYSRLPPLFISMSPSVGLMIWIREWEIYYPMLAMAIVLLQSASHRAAIVVLLRRSLLKAVGSWPFGGLEIHNLSQVSGNDITAKNKWDSYQTPQKNCCLAHFSALTLLRGSVNLLPWASGSEQPRRRDSSWR